jgi:hypothetical protein
MPPPLPIEVFEFAATMDCNWWHPVQPPSLPLPRFGLPPPLIPISGTQSHLKTCRAAVSDCNLGRMPDPSIRTDNVRPSYDCIDDRQFFSAFVSSSLDLPPSLADPCPHHRLVPMAIASQLNPAHRR